MAEEKSHNGWLEESSDGELLMNDIDDDQQAALNYVISEVENYAEDELQKVQNGEELSYGPEDDLEEDHLEVNVSTDSVRPFHIIPTPRRIALSQLFGRRASLRIDQFATNNWGFPPIPIPQINTANKRLRLAPSNIDKDFMGHPIYWIDPELTKLRDGETRDMWSIRMFYLILGFGYWDDPSGTSHWIDYPESRRFTVDTNDYEVYHQIGSPPSRYDDLHILNKNDLLVPTEDIEALYSSTVASISDSMKFETMRYSELQIEALIMAKELLGWDAQEDLPHRLPISPEESDNVWKGQLKTRLIEALDAYTKIKTSHRGIGTKDVDAMVKEINLVTDEITVVLMGIDYVIATLSIPSANHTMDYYSYANWISLLNLTFHENQNRTKYYNFTGMVEELLNGKATSSYYVDKSVGEIVANDESDPAKQAFLVINDLFSNSIDRLRLEIFNYKRLYMNLSHVDSIELMEYMERQAHVNKGDVHVPVEVEGIE